MSPKSQYEWLRLEILIGGNHGHVSPLMIHSFSKETIVCLQSNSVQSASYHFPALGPVDERHIGISPFFNFFSQTEKCKTITVMCIKILLPFLRTNLGVTLHYSLCA